jgi:hypothetical protein
MMHGQIHFGLYTTLINLNPAAYKERAKQKKKRERKERKRQPSYHHYSSPVPSGGL